MTRDQFEPIFSFLLQQKGRLNPFYVQLPNQYTARNSNFATHVASNTPTNKYASLTRGIDYMVQAGHVTEGSPKPGDMFTITDSNDSLHTKAYRVTRVMDAVTYWTGLSGADIPGSVNSPLYGTHDTAATTFTVDDNSSFPTAGTVLINSEQISYKLL